MVLVAITSQPSDSHVVSLDEHDYVDGKLPRTSFVKVSKLFTTHPTLVLKKVCAIKPARLNVVLKELRLCGVSLMWTTSGREARDTFLPGEEAPHGEGRIDGEGGSGDSAAHPPAVLGRREDSDRAGGAPREESIAALCRREGLAPNLYYRWSKEFLEAGKKRLLGDTTREATSTEVRTCAAKTASSSRSWPRRSSRIAYSKKSGGLRCGGRYVRLTAAEKHEIIRLVEGSDLSVRRTLGSWGCRTCTIRRSRARCCSRRRRRASRRRNCASWNSARVPRITDISAESRVHVERTQRNPADGSKLRTRHHQGMACDK